MDYDIDISAHLFPFNPPAAGSMFIFFQSLLKKTTHNCVILLVAFGIYAIQMILYRNNKGEPRLITIS